MISINKKYKTRRGREVRIYAVDAKGNYPVHGAIRDPKGQWELESWTTDGEYILNRTNNMDLIEIDEQGVDIRMDYDNMIEAAKQSGTKGNFTNLNHR